MLSRMPSMVSDDANDWKAGDKEPVGKWHGHLQGVDLKDHRNFPVVKNFGKGGFAEWASASIAKLAAMTGHGQALVFLVIYVAIGAAFALLLWTDEPGGVVAYGRGRPASFLECVWLSVQSMSTIGYGAIIPVSHYANAVVTLQSFVTVLYISVLTAIFIGNLLTPVPNWHVSEVATLRRDVDTGRVTLQARVVFAPGAFYTDMRAACELELFRFHRDEATGERARVGTRTEIVEFTNGLSLLRGCMWVLTCEAEEGSTLEEVHRQACGPAGQDALRQLVRDVKIKVEGTDPRLHATTSTVRLYRPDQVLANRRFADVISRDDSTGILSIDAAAIAATEPCGGSPSDNRGGDGDGKFYAAPPPATPPATAAPESPRGGAPLPLGLVDAEVGGARGELVLTHRFDGVRQGDSGGGGGSSYFGSTGAVPGAAAMGGLLGSALDTVTMGSGGGRAPPAAVSAPIGSSI